MKLSGSLDQQIAVFGESGSGKTVLLSSFYGATQEPQYLKQSQFHVIADDIGQGARLHRNFLGMRDSARLPSQTRFAADSYAFSVKLKHEGDGKKGRRRPFDALRLVWHDYPGEWFEQDVSGPEEAQRRVDAFRSLLGSDVAVILVDGQMLLDNRGQEERYLKSLLTNFRNGLLTLKADVLEGGKPLVEFPRIWILALSKADLLPDVDVFTFRDLLIDRACDEIDELRIVLAGFVESKDALSVGEDFMLLSSAKFERDRIEVGTRVGVELVLPLAAMLPFERHVRWAQARRIQGDVAERLLGGVGTIAPVVVGARALPGPLGVLAGLIRSDQLDEASQMAGDALRERNSQARAKRDHLATALTGFQLDLDRGEDERTLLRSRR